MTSENVLEALALPPAAMVAKRIPKSLLVEKGAKTATDRRNINSAIARIVWVASLKPSSTGVAPYEDKTHRYVEVAVVSLELRDDRSLTRLIELVHRAIPHPVMLVHHGAGGCGLSAAHKRMSLTNAHTVVLEPPTFLFAWGDRGGPSDAVASQIRNVASIGGRPFQDAWALYEHWIDTICLLKATDRAGQLVRFGDSRQRAERRAALAELERLDGALASLRAEARRANQMGDRVRLNLQIQELTQAERVAIDNLATARGGP